MNTALLIAGGLLAIWLVWKLITGVIRFVVVLTIIAVVAAMVLVFLSWALRLTGAAAGAIGGRRGIS